MSSFYETINAAIRDFEEHGFDSRTRLDEWVRRITEAARASMVPEHVAQEQLSRTMRAIYGRLVEKGAALKIRPGVQTFTLERVKPHLRAELDRRIAASAELIKLNRAQMIAKTQQRFSGWATSVPAGGSDAVDKKDVKANLRKALKQLPFEERRVLIDQGHKLTASIKDIVAVDGGAIAARWHSHWRQAGYNYREDHKERDDQVYLIRGNWAQEKGLVKPGPAGYTDQITAPGEEVFCFPGDSKIPFANNVEKAYRRWFCGELAEITTASGKTLRATPNHPILTRKGWVAIGLLDKGDEVIEVSDAAIPTFEKYQNDGRETTIEDIFCALNKSGVTQSFNLTPASFHGDGSDSDVDVVSAARGLREGRQSDSGQSLQNLFFPMSVQSGFGIRNVGPALFRMFNATQCGVRSLREFLAPKKSDTLHSQGIGVGNGTQINACGSQSGLDDRPANSQTPGDRQGALPREVSRGKGYRINLMSRGRWAFSVIRKLSQPLTGGSDADIKNLSEFKNGFPLGAKGSEIIQVKRYAWAGHVYNLQTNTGWYVAEDIITHNCRCGYVYLYSMRALPDDMLTAAGRATLGR